MAKETGGAQSGKKGAPVLAGRSNAAPSAERRQSLDGYASALKLMQEGKHEKAKAAFQKLEGKMQPDLAERVRMYTAACDRQLRSQKPTFETPREQYDYAISLLNQGLYDDARHHMEAVLSKDSKADYAMYGMAILHSMTGATDESLEYLERSIALNPANRLYARSDGDFQDVVDDPRFTELLYPEVQ